MELKQLEAFVKVVELQSFSKAARCLYLTQPTISAHIISLENELGCKLLERTTKLIKVTNKGERLYEYAKEITQLKEELYEEFMQQDKKNTTIAIAGSTIPSLYILPELLPTFQKENTGVCFELKQGDSEEAIKQVLMHKVDMGFVGMQQHDPKLTYIPFLEDRLVIITPNEEKYRMLFKQNCSMERLLKAPIIMRESGSGTKKEAELFLSQRGISIDSLNIVAHINDQEMIKRAVSKGMGISIISKKAVEDYVELDKVLLYEPSDQPILRNLYLVFEKKKHFSKIERKFIDYVLSYNRKGEKEFNNSRESNVD